MPETEKLKIDVQWEQVRSIARALDQEQVRQVVDDEAFFSLPKDGEPVVGELCFELKQLVALDLRQSIIWQRANPHVVVSEVLPDPAARDLHPFIYRAIVAEFGKPPAGHVLKTCRGGVIVQASDNIRSQRSSFAIGG